MPSFRYLCLNPGGRRVEGVQEAPDINRCRSLLREKGFFPVRLWPTAEGEAKNGFFSSPAKIDTRETTLVLRQLSSLISSHIPVVEAVEAVAPQIKNPHLRKTFHNLSDSLRRGLLFSEAVRREKVFPEKLPELLAASEASGTLGMVLGEFVRTEEVILALRRRVTTSLVYPLFLGGISVLVLLFLFTVVLPRITAVFSESGVILPALTRAIIATGVFLRRYGFFLLLGLAGAFFYARRSWHRPDKKEWWWKMIKRLPLLAELSNRYSLALFTRNLAILTRGGVKLIEALHLVRKILPDPFFQKDILRVEAELGKGSSLGQALEKTPLFPSMVIQMVRVGERTGELAPMLEKAAQAYEEELETELARAVALLEPVMIVVMGILVGVIVISVLLPIFEMSRIIG